MGYTSIESDEHASVRYVSIQTDDSKEEIVEEQPAEPNSHAYKPAAPANLTKGEMNLDLTPVHSSLKHLGPVEHAGTVADMTEQPSFQVSRIYQATADQSRLGMTDEPSRKSPAPSSLKRPSDLMYNHSIASIQRLSIGEQPINVYDTHRSSTLSLIKGQSPKSKQIPHTHRLFNVSSQASVAYLKASNVLQMPFSMS